MSYSLESMTSFYHTEPESVLELLHPVGCDTPEAQRVMRLPLFMQIFNSYFLWIMAHISLYQDTIHLSVDTRVLDFKMWLNVRYPHMHLPNSFWHDTAVRMAVNASQSHATHFLVVAPTTWKLDTGCEATKRKHGKRRNGNCLENLLMHEAQHVKGDAAAFTGFKCRLHLQGPDERGHVGARGGGAQYRGGQVSLPLDGVRSVLRLP